MNNESKLLSQYKDIDETSLKYMLRLSAPMIITTISYTLMQFVDRLMVSRLGTEALAAIIPAGIIGFVPASFAIGVMSSVNTYVSQSLGRGDKKACSNYCWQAIYLGLIYSVFVFGILWPSAGWIFRTMGFSPEVVELEVTYLRIMIYVQFLAVFIWAFNQFYMGVHRPVITMYSAFAAQVVNITFNYILIFGKFGFPAMGIAGAGWGTFIGGAVGAGIRIFIFLSGDINRTYKSRQTFQADFRKMADLIKVGSPAGFGFMVNVAFLGIILFGLVSRFGTSASAATSALFSCFALSIMPIVGISTALTAAVGKAIGEGKKRVAMKQTSSCLKVTVCYMVVVGICFFVFREQIMHVWSRDPVVVEIGASIFICLIFFQLFDGVAVLYIGALRGAGDTLWLAGISAFGAIVILGVGGFILVKFRPELGAMGPWIAATVNITVVGLANRWRFKSKQWMKIDLFKRYPATIAPEAEVGPE
ncbi:MAG: MATE family efflux transporter [Planctomycetota bacterium]|jgi:MATE family multidrug resistance protein